MRVGLVCKRVQITKRVRLLQLRVPHLRPLSSLFMIHGNGAVLVV